MAAVPCPHTAVWGCSCVQPVPTLCTACLPLHVQSPGQHSFSPLGPQGSYICGICQGQSSDPLAYQYPVSICQRCVQRSTVQPRLAPPQVLERPAVQIPSEEGGAVGQAGSLQERFLKQKSDFEGNILGARTHLNDLESAFNGALRQEEELRTCQTQLAQAQADLLHLRASQP